MHMQVVLFFAQFIYISFWFKKNNNYHIFTVAMKQGDCNIIKLYYAKIEQIECLSVF
jgi:hypothetical protein